MGGTMAGWQEREMRRWEGLEKAIAWVPGQVGWMAWVQGAWQSVEVVSRMAAWRRWHGKALRCVLAGADPRGAHHGWDMPGTSMGGARRPDGCWMNWPLGTGHAARA